MNQMNQKKNRRRNQNRDRITKAALAMTAAFSAGALIWICRTQIARPSVRYGILAAAAGIFLAAWLWSLFQRRQVSSFADTLCRELDDMMEGRSLDTDSLYEDTLTARVQGKLLKFYEVAEETRAQSRRDKETIQALVSDISHQVKTPIANIRMFTGILKDHSLSDEKRAEFLDLMDNQAAKLDFLMQSLIKMSRLEVGTFVLHVEECSLYETVARSVSLVWTKAEQKDISLTVECESGIMVRHDSKWTAEALGNILDNAVKYTPRGGQIKIRVRPWQMYTRIDLSDTGIGIDPEHYHDIFKRFYRAQEVAGEEGVGLGLYLANEIIRLQKGYITVKSEKGKGSTFTVYLLN